MIHPPHPRRSKNFKLFKPKFLEISRRDEETKIIKNNSKESPSFSKLSKNPSISPSLSIRTSQLDQFLRLSAVCFLRAFREILSRPFYFVISGSSLVDGVVALWMGANLKFIRRRAPPPSALSLRGRDNCSSLERRRRRRRGAGQSVPSLPLPPCLFK